MGEPKGMSLLQVKIRRSMCFNLEQLLLEINMDLVLNLCLSLIR